MYIGPTLDFTRLNSGIVKSVNDAVRKMVEYGADPKKLRLLTSLEEMKLASSVKTHSGVIKVMYNPYLSPGQFYLMNEADFPDEWKLPDYAPADRL